MVVFEYLHPPISVSLPNVSNNKMMDSVNSFEIFKAFFTLLAKEAFSFHSCQLETTPCLIAS